MWILTAVELEANILLKRDFFNYKRETLSRKPEARAPNDPKAKWADTRDSRGAVRFLWYPIREASHPVVTS